ncbi:MAG: 2-hydroxyacid dehydrogenase [Saprospiraceae bacterium]
MSIAILTNHKDPIAWKKALQEKLPEVAINIVETNSAALTAEFLVCWKPKKDQLAAFSNLKVIQSLGAGVDHIFDTNKIKAPIKVVRIVDPNLMVDMWEYTLAATMNYLKDFPTYAQQAERQSWKQHQYKTIPTTTVSIMGLGKIGGYVAEQFAKIGFKVQGWSNSLKSMDGVKTFAGQSHLADFLKNTDVLINILPLTATTQGILNHQLLTQLPKGAHIINVGRGGHLMEKDLLPLVENGQLSGATLDVFQEEPLPKNHPFWAHPKIVVTPHIASLTNVQSAVNQVVENYQRMKKGVDLLNEVSPKKGY